VDWKIVHLDETDSTNRWLREQACEEDMVVVADSQTAGRGCGTNTWESAPGQNLTFSLLVHPTAVPANAQFLISMAISLCIADVLGDYFGEVSIKWPNDIYWRDRKLCGILIEQQLSGSLIRQSIIGIGLNVNQTVFVSDAPNPVSMRQILGHEVSREEVLEKILSRFSLEAVDRDRYRSLLYRREGYHPYSDANGTFEARLLTVEDDGHLLLCDREGQRRRYAFKEVHFELSSSPIVKL